MPPASRAAAAAALLVGSAAYPTYVPFFPNGAKVPGVAAIGHVNPSGGGPNNAFGLAFLMTNMDQTSWAAMCALDSDLDGQFNGQELGDPCCTWVPGAGKDPLFISDISNPGDKNSKTSRPYYNCSAPAPPPSATSTPAGAPSPPPAGPPPLNESPDPTVVGVSGSFAAALVAAGAAGLIWGHRRRLPGAGSGAGGAAAGANGAPLSEALLADDGARGV
jgi:hypothetical protein